MKKEIKVKHIEYGVVTVDIPENEDPYDAVFDAYCNGEVVWGKDELDIVQEV